MLTLRYTPIPAAFYVAKRDQLAAQLPAGSLVIIHSNDVFPTNADGTFPHHQNANLFYLCGVDQEESILIMRVGENGEHKDTLLLRETNEMVAIWEGARLDQAEATALTGIEDVRWESEYQSLIAQFMPEAKCVYLERDNHPRRLTYVQTRNERQAAALQANWPDAKLENLYDILTSMRMIKSEEEIEQLRRACQTTGEGFVALLPHIKPGVGEWELEGQLSCEYIRRRSRGFSFTPIMASGADSCVLHYISNHKECEEGGLILLDIGAEYGGYAGDMSRTVPVNGKYTERQKAVYNACLAVHKKAMEIMRPGLSKMDYETQVRRAMAVELIKLGLITQEEVDADMVKAVRRYFMHGTSHSLGLDVHDVCPNEVNFAVNQVWTIEPGIYIREEGIGIRIETDVVVREDGVEDLLAGVPIEVEEIEALMAAALPAEKSAKKACKKDCKKEGDSNSFLLGLE